MAAIGEAVRNIALAEGQPKQLTRNRLAVLLDEPESSVSDGHGNVPNAELRRWSSRRKPDLVPETLLPKRSPRDADAVNDAKEGSC